MRVLVHTRDWFPAGSGSSGWERARNCREQRAARPSGFAGCCSSWEAAALGAPGARDRLGHGCPI